MPKTDNVELEKLINFEFGICGLQALVCHYCSLIEQQKIPFDFAFDLGADLGFGLLGAGLKREEDKVKGQDRLFQS